MLGDQRSGIYTQKLKLSYWLFKLEEDPRPFCSFLGQQKNWDEGNHYMSAANCTQSKEIKIIHTKLMPSFICHKYFIFYLGMLGLASNFLLCWHSGSELKETAWAVPCSSGQTLCVEVPLETEIHFFLPFLFINWIVFWFNFLSCSFWEIRQETCPLFSFYSRCSKKLSSFYKFRLS